MTVPDPQRRAHSGKTTGVVDLAVVQAQARALGDPTRYAIFRRLADASEPLTVAELTAEAGLHHTAVRQHLAKLLAAGLVVEEAEHRTTRGRPRLRYTVAPAAAERWGGPGPYERLAVLLAEALRPGASLEEIGRRAAWKTPGRPVADGPVAAMVAEMAGQGFEPALRQRRVGVEVVLGHCPYQAAAVANQDAVCAVHLALARGVAEQVGGVEVEGLVPGDPRRAGCRLLLRRAPEGT